MNNSVPFNLVNIQINIFVIILLFYFWWLLSWGLFVCVLLKGWRSIMVRIRGRDSDNLMPRRLFEEVVKGPSWCHSQQVGHVHFYSSLCFASSVYEGSWRRNYWQTSLALSFRRHLYVYSRRTCPLRSACLVASSVRRRRRRRTKVNSKTREEFNWALVLFVCLARISCFVKE